MNEISGSSSFPRVGIRPTCLSLISKTVIPINEYAIIVRTASKRHGTSEPFAQTQGIVKKPFPCPAVTRETIVIKSPFLATLLIDSIDCWETRRIDERIWVETFLRFRVFGTLLVEIVPDLSVKTLSAKKRTDFPTNLKVFLGTFWSVSWNRI